MRRNAAALQEAVIPGHPAADRNPQAVAFAYNEIHRPKDLTSGTCPNQRGQLIRAGEIGDHLGDATVESTLSEALGEWGDGPVAVGHLEADEHLELSQLRSRDLIDAYELVFSVSLVGNLSGDVVADGTPNGPDGRIVA